MFLKHEIRTPLRTTVFLDALQSLGRVLRVNRTLWLLVTEHSSTHVLDSVQARLKCESRIDDAGDIFVIDASAFAGSTSQETVTQIQAVLDGVLTPPPLGGGSNKKTATKSKAVGIFPFDKQSRNEQIAEEYGIKTTDAMFRKVSGSFESKKR